MCKIIIKFNTTINNNSPSSKSWLNKKINVSDETSQTILSLESFNILKLFFVQTYFNNNV